MGVYERSKELLKSDDSSNVIQIATLVRQAIAAHQVLVLVPASSSGDQLHIIWSDPVPATGARSNSCQEEQDYLLPLDSLRGLAKTKLNGKKSDVKYFKNGFLWDASDLGKDNVEAIRLELKIGTDPLVFIWIRSKHDLFTEKCRRKFERLLSILRSRGTRQMHKQPMPVYSAAEAMPRLSPTEKKVMGYLMKGLTEREIATKMGRSHNTIHSHVRNIYRSYLVHSRAELLQQIRESDVNC